MEKKFIDNDCLNMASKGKGKIKSPTNLAVENKSGRKSARFRDPKSPNKVYFALSVHKILVICHYQSEYAFLILSLLVTISISIEPRLSWCRQVQ